MVELLRLPTRAATIAAVLLLAGCASLPSSGPTAKEIVRATAPDRNAIGMRIVAVNGDVLANVLAQAGGADARLAGLAALARPGRNDVVGPGDQLDISVFEVGVSLFGAGRVSTDGFDPSAQGQRFPAVTVDRAGMIRLPYAGTVQAAGKTPNEIAATVERAYHGKSQTPQVVVSVRGNVSATVFVSGDVRRPGRLELSLQNERLLDAIATAGGTVSPMPDMLVRFTRDGAQIEERLDRVLAGAPDDLVLVPGDRVELIRRPRSYVVLGAANRPAQVQFEQTDLTLAEAVARAGGPNDGSANPRAVFLFRYDPPDPTQPVAAATAPRPTIYQLNLMEPASYFIAQRFPMRDKDVLYVSNAAINRTGKLVGIINQLFSPFVAARTVTGQ